MGGNVSEVPDGTHVKEACLDVGVSFGCEQGRCGTCKSEVLKGMENLETMNDAERAFGLEGNERLLCQCRIKRGEIEIRHE